MKQTHENIMESLIDGTILKEGVIGADMLPSAVSVVAVSVPNVCNEAEGTDCSDAGVRVHVGDVGTGTQDSVNEENQLVPSSVMANGETHIIQHVTLDQGQETDVSLLSSETISLPLTNQNEVLQLQIQPGLDCKLQEESPEVILVYQDLLTCGACSKQFVDMIEFLEHKTQHTIGGNLHKCDLCQIVFRSEASIIDHYQKYHNVNIFREQSVVGELVEEPPHPDDPSIATSIDDIDMGSKVNESTAIQMSEFDDVNKVIINDPLAVANVGLSNGDVDCVNGQGDSDVLCIQTNGHHIDFPKENSVTDTGASVAVDELSENQLTLNYSGNEPNLLTSLSKGLQSLINPKIKQGCNTGKKAAPKIPSTFYKCLHCEFKTTSKLSMSRHMKESHPSLIIAPKADRNVANISVASNAEEVQTGDAVNTLEIIPQTEAETAPKPDFNFILQTEMVKGSSFTYGKTWFKCLHCDFKTNAKTSMTKHMLEVHLDLLELHQNLDVKDIAVNDKRTVMKMSAYENLFGRESRFRRRAKKGKRIVKQDLPGVYNCTTCGKVFTRIRYLRKHLVTHRTEKKYLCDECGKSFKSRTYLSVHRRIHKEKLFRCNQCDFKSKINAAIHAHRQVHSQGSVLCDICGYAYTDKSTLSKHKRVHDLNRPFTCNFPGCTWRFKTEVMCKAHIRAHTTEGKFKCSFCGYLFRHKHHLQRHETSMHGVKHTKSRTNHSNKARRRPEIQVQETTEAVDVVIDEIGEVDSLQLTQDSEGIERHLVVATDTQGTPIAFEGTDLTALNVAYQTLLQSHDGAGDGRTLIMTQPDTQIIFKQEY